MSSLVIKVIWCEISCDIIGSYQPEFKAPLNSGLLPVAEKTNTEWLKHQCPQVYRGVPVGVASFLVIYMVPINILISKK